MTFPGAWMLFLLCAALGCVNVVLLARLWRNGRRRDRALTEQIDRLTERRSVPPRQSGDLR